jgi:hypothetical protein
VLHPQVYLQHFFEAFLYIAKMRSTVALILLAAGVRAQQSAYGQCKIMNSSENQNEPKLNKSGGGDGWTGATTCVAGYVCTATR